MKLYDPEKPLISLHIPKCGGTSFRAVLQHWFGPNLYRHCFYERLTKPPRKYDLEGGMCIHGHFNRKRQIGVSDYYPEVDQFITILRDPFEMTVSRYFYAKGKGATRFRDGHPVEAMQERFADVRAYLR